MGIESLIVGLASGSPWQRLMPTHDERRGLAHL